MPLTQEDALDVLTTAIVQRLQTAQAGDDGTVDVQTQTEIGQLAALAEEPAKLLAFLRTQD